MRDPLRAPTLSEITDARERITGSVVRTPLVRFAGGGEKDGADIRLKLETLQPIGSFKLRGALNAMRMLPASRLRDGVYTASAGNMAQGVAWAARALGIPCRVVAPDHAPQTKIDAIERLGATVRRIPFADWWRALIDHGVPGERGHFLHPGADRDVMAGNATIGLEIVEDLPDVDAILVPYGSGGLACAIAAAAHALRPSVRVYACELEGRAPFAASLAAGHAVTIDYTPSFVDGIGGKSVLDEMWPLASTMLAGSMTAPLADVAAAVRLLAERTRVVAEGAGATPLAVALGHALGPPAFARIACVVSGGNIDSAKLATILSGGIP